MIRINNLTKSYNGSKVLHGISLEAREGEIYGFLGHNGAGKTTTMNIIAGLAPYNSGSVELGGDGRIGFVPESPAFYETLSLKEYLSFVANISRTSLSKEALAELIDRIGLTKHRNRRISRFSRGMKQRAAIGAALIGDPKIILLDEPTSALDPEGRRDVMDIINKLKEEGKTVFLSTHILSDVEDICDRVGVLKEGRMLYEDSMTNLRAAHKLSILDVKFTEGYLEHLDDIKGAIGHVGTIEDLDFGLEIHVDDVKEGMALLINSLGRYGRLVEHLSVRSLGLTEIYMQVEGGIRDENI